MAGFPSRFTIAESGLIRTFESTVWQNAEGDWMIRTVSKYPLIGEVTSHERVVDREHAEFIHDEFDVVEEWGASDRP